MLASQYVILEMGNISFSEGGISTQDCSLENHSPAVSIIVVTYNAEATLQRCLDSISCQTYSNYEIIVIDGASSDSTINILKDNSNLIHYWRSEKDSGIYEAMNKALNYISGEWVLFIGADDELLADFSKMAPLLSGKNVIHYASVLYNGRKCIGYVNPYKFAKLGLHHQAVFYDSSIFKKYRYNTAFRIAADYVLNITCYKDKSIKFHFHDYIVAKYNHTGISAFVKDELLEQVKSDLILSHFGVLIWLRYYIKIIKKNLKTWMDPSAGK
jgi:glycosyltransferase involved in cell wall biosynthesis